MTVTQSGLGQATQPSHKNLGTARVGQPLALGDLSYRVRSIRQAKTLGAEHPTVGRFVIIELDVSSRANETRTVRASGIVFHTAADKVYDQDNQGRTVLFGEENKQVWGVSDNDVPPGATKSGFLVYDVPPSQIPGALLDLTADNSDDYGFMALGL